MPGCKLFQIINIDIYTNNAIKSMDQPVQLLSMSSKLPSRRGILCGVLSVKALYSRDLGFNPGESSGFKDQFSLSKTFNKFLLVVS